VANPRTGKRSSFSPLKFTGTTLRLLDQLALPLHERWLTSRTPAEVARAIRNMNVRGAPAIGVAAGYGLALAAVSSRARTAKALLRDLDRAGGILVRSRPTAVNLAWAVNRVLGTARSAKSSGPAAVRSRVIADARAIEREDLAANYAIGAHGAPLIPRGAQVLTHCNTGALATAGYGTALGVIRAAWAKGRIRHVLADETRPYLQGARLTAWELKRDRIPFTLITDSMAAHFMARGAVDVVLVGADRITANGDVANKIGTYSLAVLARAHGIPFYVAAPVSTVDPATKHGKDIVIEERSADEVLRIGPVRIAPPGTKAAHPAFDVTPARLVSAIITERGVARPPFAKSLKALLKINVK
jgi:methylthioribose-1-phosphate isomerase